MRGFNVVNIFDLAFNITSKSTYIQQAQYVASSSV